LKTWKGDRNTPLFLSTRNSKRFSLPGVKSEKPDNPGKVAVNGAILRREISYLKKLGVLVYND